MNITGKFKNNFKKSLSFVLALILVMSGLVFPQTKALADGGTTTDRRATYQYWYDRFNGGNPEKVWMKIV